MSLRRCVAKLNSRTVLWTVISLLLSAYLVQNDCQSTKSYSCRTCSRREICTCYSWGNRCEFCRERLAKKSGKIKVDGYGQLYPGPSRCSWLIQAPGVRVNSSIKLEVKKFKLENEDSHLYIHDGSSAFDPLIAVISGQGCWDSVEDLWLCPLSPKLLVEAHSGSAFVHLSTKSNSAIRNEFELDYTAIECSVQCNNHQTCSNDQEMCICKLGWEGASCNVSRCHVECDKGTCNKDTKQCQCTDHHRGQFCQISSESDGQGYWSSLISHGEENIEGRGSHAVGLVGSWMWVVGGTALYEHRQFNDLSRYEVTKNLWQVIKVSNVNEQPMRTFGHSIVVYNESLYLFGGDVGGAVTDELWKFDTNTLRWTNLTQRTLIRISSIPGKQWRPVGVAGHSATLVQENKMVVLFGFSRSEGYSTKVQEYNIDTGIWSVKEILYSEGGFVIHGCYGHVSVYEPLTNQIIGHGGYRGVIIGDTWAYDPDRSTLRRLNPSPSPRFLHSAVIVGHMMYIQGGITVTDENNHRTRSFVLDFTVFDLVCNSWKTISTRGMRDNFARYGHTAVHHNGTIYVFGGFNGQMLNNVLTYSLANCSLWMYKESCKEAYDTTGCRWNRKKESCELNTHFKAIDVCPPHSPDDQCQEKFWCKKYCQSYCSHKVRSKNKVLRRHLGRAPKLRLACNQRRTCRECVQKGTSVPEDWKVGTCSWCQSHKTCVSSDECLAVFPYGRCLQWTEHSCKEVECESKKVCRDCQTLPWCGWKDSGFGTGLGRCMEGGFDGPKGSNLTNSSNLWFFITCPACQCNGHSKCYNNTECFRCADHTQGSHCELCASGYYGDPRNGQSCTACTCNKKMAKTCDHSTGRCDCLAMGVTGYNCSECQASEGFIGNSADEGCFSQLRSQRRTFNLTGKTSVNFVYAPAEFKRDVKLKLNVLKGVHVKMNLTSSYRDGSREERKLRTFQKITKGYPHEYDLKQKTYKFGPPDFLVFKVYIFNVIGDVELEVHFYQPQFPQIDLLTYVLATFFGCFIAVLFVIALAWRIRSRYMNYVRSRQRRVKRRQMASRPFGKVHLVVDRPVNSPLKPSASPVVVEACDPRGKSHASVTTLIVRLPADENGVTPVGQSGICFASVLVSHNLECAKNACHGRVGKRKKSKTPVTTWV